MEAVTSGPPYRRRSRLSGAAEAVVDAGPLGGVGRRFYGYPIETFRIDAVECIVERGGVAGGVGGHLDALRDGLGACEP